MAAKRPTTFDLFATPGKEPLGADWPPAARFPLNEDSAHVADTVLTDLQDSEHPLIVTGFATLDRLIDFVATADRCHQVRVVFGTEPFDSHRAEFSLKSRDLPREMKKYWLERGISVLLSGKLLVCIERLKTGKVLARYVSRSRWRLHAKIYVGDQAATIGSSNFTDSGLKNQLEANVRFQRHDDTKKPSQREEDQRYRETVQIAEQIWDLGTDYNKQLINLCVFQ